MIHKDRQAKTVRKSGATRAVAAAVALAIAPAASVAAGQHEDPHMKADETWIDINGTVQTVNPDSFILDYGDGVVTVEMDDGDRDADAYVLVPGDKVSVSGMIDDDFYETTSIEASSIYVENIGTTFFSSSIDEEDMLSAGIAVTSPILAPDMVVRGFVTDVDAESFVIDTGPRELIVDISELSYDPLDGDGYLKVGVGDHVKVSGEINRNLFEGRELVAESVIELHYSPTMAGIQ